MTTGIGGFFRHQEAVLSADIPELSVTEFRTRVVEACRDGARLAALFGQPRGAGAVRLFAVLAFDGPGRLACWSTAVEDRYPALTPQCPQAQGFEREIAEQWGVCPEGHPWLKPLRFHHSYQPGYDAWGRSKDAPLMPGVTDFFTMQGTEVHEVAVGPVHAGVIEPGHFRFQCHGEQVFHLEIALGYQHRGVERAMWGGPNRRTIPYAETLAGDTTIGHTLAYCQSIEALANCRVPVRAQAWRAIALELERLANHTGDLGALANDIGFLPTASYCGRIRGDFLNMTALLCGSRFGRGLVRPGGVAFDLVPAAQAQLQQSLQQARRDVAGAVELLWNESSVLGRFENTGAVSRHGAGTGSGWRGGPRQRGGTRCAGAISVRLLSFCANAVVYLSHRHRFRSSVRPLDGNSAQLDLYPGATANPARRAHPLPARPAGARAHGRGPGGRLARRNLSRRLHRCRRAFRPLQGRGSVVPQLDGPGYGAPRRTHLRFSAVQQKFQFVLLWT